MKVGVLGLQGDVREHLRALEDTGVTPVVVKTSGDLASVDGVVIPGGESTTIGKLLDRYGLLEPLRDRIRSGMRAYGTCAGMILMATDVSGSHETPHLLGVLDVSVQRNAYGRQVESFEADIDVDGLDERFHAVFIRAPVVERTGEGIEVLASWDGTPVLVRQGHLLASSFHPEITGDGRIHRMFVDMLEEH